MYVIRDDLNDFTNLDLTNFTDFIINFNTSIVILKYELTFFNQIILVSYLYIIDKYIILINNYNLIYQLKNINISYRLVIFSFFS